FISQQISQLFRSAIPITADNFLFPTFDQMNLEEFIKAALQEDIGEGDHTTLATIGENATGKAEIIVKEACIISGIVLADQVFTHYDSTLNVKTHFKDGDRIVAGTVCITIEGRLRSILS